MTAYLAKRTPFYYGWVILATSALLLGLSYTIWYSFSLFFVAIIEEFGWSRASTAGVYSVAILVNGALCPLSGALVDRWGPRPVVTVGALIFAAGLAACSTITEIWQYYLFLSLVGAVGMNAVSWVPNVTLLNNWFVRRSGMVIGVASAGIGAGMLFGLPAEQYLIGSLGWRNTYLVLAGAALLLIIPITLIFQRRRPQDLGLLPDGDSTDRVSNWNDQDRLVLDRQWASRHWTVATAAGTTRFWFIFFAGLLISFAMQMILAHQVALLVDSGYDKMLAATAVGLVGIASVGGRLGWGALSDRWGREISFSLGMACALVGIALLIWARTFHAPWLPYVYSAWMGIGYAVMALIPATVGADLFRGRSFGTVFGLISLGGQLGGSLGTWLAGYVFDVTQDYLVALLIAMASVLACCACLWLAAPRRVRLVPGQAKRLGNLG